MIWWSPTEGHNLPFWQFDHHRHWWYVAQSLIYKRWYVALWKIHDFNFSISRCSHITPPPPVLVALLWPTDLRDTKTQRKTKGKYTRRVSLQYLRGFWGWESPHKEGGGEASPYIRTPSKSQINSNYVRAKLCGPDISSNDKSRQTPVWKYITLMLRCLPANLPFLREGWLKIFSTISFFTRPAAHTNSAYPLYSI